MNEPHRPPCSEDECEEPAFGLSESMEPLCYDHTQEHYTNPAKSPELGEGSR